MTQTERRLGDVRHAGPLESLTGARGVRGVGSDGRFLQGADMTLKKIAGRVQRVKTPKAVEHGPESAHYDNARGHVPAILCLCGAYFDAQTWEEVGQAFDDHLKEVAT